MNKLIVMLTAICLAITVTVIGYTVYPQATSPSILGSEKGYVVLDMLRLNIAQQKQVSNIIGEKATASGYAEAFRAAGDIKNAANRIAGNKDVMVKQAFLSTDAKDITGEVIEYLGLPKTAPGESAPKRSGIEPGSVPDSIKEGARDFDEMMKQKRSISPYE